MSCRRLCSFSIALASRSIHLRIGRLSVIDNPTLKTVCLANLSVVHGAADVKHNDRLEELELPQLLSLGGDLKLWDNDNMTRIELPSLSSMANLEVAWNDQLERFATPVTSTGSIAFVANHQLKDVLMPNATEIDGELRLAYNGALRELSSFNMLKTVAGDINIIENEVLLDISGLGQLRTVKGDFQVSSNPALRDLSGLSSDLSVGGNLQISENDDKFLGLSGMSTMPNVKGYAVLSFNCSKNAVRPPNKATCAQATKSNIGCYNKSHSSCFFCKVVCVSAGIAIEITAGFCGSVWHARRSL